MNSILKKNKILYCLLMFMAPSLFVHGQGSEFNLKKYWYLRWRLSNYFMVVGEGPGKSLPAGIREKYFDDMVHGMNQNPSTHA